MLKVYRKVNSKVYNAEYFFNQNIKRFDVASGCAEKLLWTLSRVKYEGAYTILTPYGKGALKDLDVPCKLALCLLEFPTIVFSDWGCSEKAMEVILKLPEGSLLLTRSSPYSYYFGVKCAINGKRLVTSSTELNTYMYLEDINGVKGSMQ